MRISSSKIVELLLYYYYCIQQQQHAVIMALIFAIHDVWVFLYKYTCEYITVYCFLHAAAQTPAAAIFTAAFTFHRRYIPLPPLTGIFIFDYTALTPYQIENYAYRWNYHASFAM